MNNIIQEVCKRFITEVFFMAEKKSNGAPGAVYFISTSSVGQGSPDLGEAIMKSWMTALTQKQTPAALIFANSGVHLTVA